MPNTNPQAIRIANEKLRPAADRFGQLYNSLKALQAEAQAEGWPALFAGGASNVLSDGSDVDGRTPVTDADISGLITMASAFITWMEASSNANRNLALKIAVSPDRF